MKHLDFFSGIGGFALACEWAGIETIGFVEIDKYCQKVLRKHWPDVPIVEDIRDVEKIKEIVANATKFSNSELCDNGNSQSYQESKGQFRGDSLRVGVLPRETTETKSPALLITAGFPCQPFSVAGKRQGERDDRYLWPETLAVIKAVKPSWILLENVTGIINLALDTVLSDLEGTGYAYETLIIPACAVNAWHRRDRVWIIANNDGIRQLVRGVFTGDNNSLNREGDKGSKGSIISNDNSTGQWWAVEPELGRVAHGIPHRVDRLKCLGNAIVPQVAFEIIKMIKEWEL